MLKGQNAQRLLDFIEVKNIIYTVCKHKIVHLMKSYKQICIQAITKNQDNDQN